MKRLAALLLAVGAVLGLTVAFPATVAPSETVSQAQAHDCGDLYGTWCHVTPQNVGAWWGYQEAYSQTLYSEKYGWRTLPPGYVADADANWTHIRFNTRQCIIFDHPDGGVNRSTAYTLCNTNRTQPWIVPFGNIPGVWGVWSDGFLPDDVN